MSTQANPIVDNFIDFYEKRLDYLQSINDKLIDIIDEDPEKQTKEINSKIERLSFSIKDLTEAIKAFKTQHDIS